MDVKPSVICTQACVPHSAVNLVWDVQDLSANQAEGLLSMSAPYSTISPRCGDDSSVSSCSTSSWENGLVEDKYAYLTHDPGVNDPVQNSASAMYTDMRVHDRGYLYGSSTSGNYDSAEWPQEHFDYESTQQTYQNGFDEYYNEEYRRDYENTINPNEDFGAMDQYPNPDDRHERYIHQNFLYSKKAWLEEPDYIPDRLGAVAESSTVRDEQWHEESSSYQRTSEQETWQSPDLEWRHEAHYRACGDASDPRMLGVYGDTECVSQESMEWNSETSGHRNTAYSQPDPYSEPLNVGDSHQNWEIAGYGVQEDGYRETYQGHVQYEQYEQYEQNNVLVQSPKSEPRLWTDSDISLAPHTPTESHRRKSRNNSSRPIEQEHIPQPEYLSMRAYHTLSGSPRYFPETQFEFDVSVRTGKERNHHEVEYDGDDEEDFGDELWGRNGSSVDFEEGNDASYSVNEWVASTASSVVAGAVSATMRVMGWFDRSQQSLTRTDEGESVRFMSTINSGIENVAQNKALDSNEPETDECPGDGLDSITTVVESEDMCAELQ